MPQPYKVIEDGELRYRHSAWQGLRKRVARQLVDDPDLVENLIRERIVCAHMKWLSNGHLGVGPVFGP